MMIDPSDLKGLAKLADAYDREAIIALQDEDNSVRHACIHFEAADHLRAYVERNK